MHLLPCEVEQTLLNFMAAKKEIQSKLHTCFVIYTIHNNVKVIKNVLMPWLIKGKKNQDVKYQHNKLQMGYETL